MPDPPPSRRRPVTAVAGQQPPATEVPYAELHCRTNYSFLEGASHPDELVNRAAELGLKALAITDRNSVAGVVRAHAAAIRTDLQLIPGAEITPADAAPILLLPMTRNGWSALSRLITLGRRREEKGRSRHNCVSNVDFRPVWMPQSLPQRCSNCEKSIRIAAMA
jgi:error-prone DNA polymerase